MSKEINLIRLNYTRMIGEYNLLKERINYEINENNNNRVGIFIFIFILILSFCFEKYYLETNIYINSDFYLIWIEKINNLVLYSSLVMSLGYAYKIITFKRNIINMKVGHNEKFMVWLSNIEKNLSEMHCNFKIERSEDSNGVAFLSQRSLDEINVFLSSQEEFSVIDPITKVSTRLAYFLHGEREFERCRRYKSPLSIICFDIKLIGLHGISIFDSALFEVGQACLHKFRSADTVGHLGDGGFSVLLPETNLAGAEIAAEQLRIILDKITIKESELSGSTPPVSAFFGVAEYQDGDDNFESLFARADKAMYKAKLAILDRVFIS